MVLSPSSQTAGWGHGQRFWQGTLLMDSPMGLLLALLPNGEEEGTRPGWEDGVLGMGRRACDHCKLPSQSFSTCGSRLQALVHEALRLLLSTPHAVLSSQPSLGASAPAPFSCCSTYESGDGLGVNHVLALPRGETVRLPAPNKRTPTSEIERCAVCLLLCVCVCIYAYLHLRVFVCICA